MQNNNNKWKQKENNKQKRKTLCAALWRSFQATDAGSVVGWSIQNKAQQQGAME